MFQHDINELRALSSLVTNWKEIQLLTLVPKLIITTEEHVATNSESLL